MSEQRLPDRIDPFRLAQAGRTLAGDIALSTLPRLRTYLAAAEGVVNVELDFGVDEAGVKYVAGWVKAQVQMICQRCLEAMPVAIRADLRLGLIEDEAQAERLPQQYEPLVTTPQPLYLKDIIEDELILALPIVPRHPAGMCPAEVPIGTADDAGAEREKKKTFSVLAELKKRH